jgi:hypothetical protein
VAGQSALQRKIVLFSVSYMYSVTGVRGVATRPVKVNRVSVCRMGRVVQTERIFAGPHSPLLLPWPMSSVPLADTW